MDLSEHNANHIIASVCHLESVAGVYLLVWLLWEDSIHKWVTYCCEPAALAFKLDDSRSRVNHSREF